MYFNNIEILLQIILQQYILPTRCITVISDKICNTINLPRGISIVNVILDLNDSSSVINTKTFQNYGCQTFILNVKYPSVAFSQIEQQVKYQNETLAKRKYIIINLPGKTEKVFKILKTREIDFVSDLLIISSEKMKMKLNKGILDSATEEFTLTTHKYIGSDRNKLVLLDRWYSVNRSFLLNAALFPDKLHNQQGRQIKIGFFQYEPYIICRWNPSTKSLIINGMEGELLKLFFQKHNIGKKFILIRNEYWGDVYENGTVYGLRGDVYNEKIDIGVAANFATDRMNRFFGISSPTIRVGITCLVPAPKFAAGWLTPTFVYTSGTWKAIFSGYILIVLSIYYLEIIIRQNRLRHLGKSQYVALIIKLGKVFFGAAKLFLNQGLNKAEMLRGISGIIFTFIALFYTFFLSRVYESGLASIMTLPWYEGSIETRDDFLKSNLTWGGIQTADWVGHWKTDKQALYRKAYDRYIAAPSTAELRKLLDLGNFGLLIERLPQHKYHFPFPSLENSKNIHLMKEDLHWEFTVFLLRKSSVLLPLLNEFIIRMNASGITRYLLNKAIGVLMHQTTQGIIHYNANTDKKAHREAVQLKLSHIAGVFGIIFIGHFIAFLMFIAEHIYYSRYKHTTK